LLLEEIKELFANETLQNKLQSLKYDPLIRKERLSDLKLKHVQQIDEHNTIETIDKAARADLVLIFASAEDCADSHQRDRLTSAYGFLVARLGQQRVQLIYPQSLPEGVMSLTGSTFSSQTSVHRFEKSLGEIADGLREVLDKVKARGELLPMRWTVSGVI